MRIELLISIIFTASAGSVSGQDYELPQMKYYYPNSYYWPDSVSTSQKAYWENGNLKVEYLDVADGRKIRKEYFPEGRLMATVEVKQYYILDTSLIFNPDTYEDSMIINEGFTDVLDGDYIEYHGPGYSDSAIPQTRGYYKNGIMFGQWETRKGALGEIISANFNEKGELEGEYLEYYWSNKQKKEKIKIKGQYHSDRRIGKWFLYRADGSILSTVAYKWKGDKNN